MRRVIASLSVHLAGLVVLHIYGPIGIISPQANHETQDD
jgi:hypothetical protein